MRKSVMAAVAIAILLGAGGPLLAQPQAEGYTLSDLYYYLVEGTEASWGAHSLEPPEGSVPGDSRFQPVDQIYQDIQAIFEQCSSYNELAPQVETGYYFFSTDSNYWGVQEGTYEPPWELDFDLIQETERYALYEHKVTADRVTIDKNNNLMWASVGNAAGCYNGSTRTWQQALDWADGLNFAGFDDWRMPEVYEGGGKYELDALLEGSSAPYINATFFPNTVQYIYWSSVTHSDVPTCAWYVRHDYGSAGSSDKSNKYHVRACRGGE